MPRGHFHWLYSDRDCIWHKNSGLVDDCQRGKVRSCCWHVVSANGTPQARQLQQRMQEPCRQNGITAEHCVRVSYTQPTDRQYPTTTDRHHTVSVVTVLIFLLAVILGRFCRKKVGFRFSFLTKAL